MRFPFDKYKSEKWDIEHVCSQTNKEITPQKWIDNILEYFTGKKDVQEADTFVFNDDKVKEICTTLNQLKIRKVENTEDKEFNKVFQLVQVYFKKDSQTEGKHAISNLALLDATTNRSYGNSFFPIKRRKIIENDKNGIFVPIATKNLFLKYYSKKMGEIMYWTSTDADDYLDAIKETLKDFLPKKDTENE